MIENFYYIAEFSLPSTSAYSIHVIKILDRFSEKSKNTTLIIPFIKKNYNFNEISKNYNLKNKFLIKNFFFNKKKNNFFYRFFFSIKILIFFLLKFYEKKVIYSRSIVTSLILSIFQIKNILEIHHELKGFTKFLYNITNFKIFRKNISFVLLHKNLEKFLNINFSKKIILEDCVEIRDFKNIKTSKKNNIFKCAYFGSLTKGKGLEIIIKLSAKFKNLLFLVYGDKKLIFDKKLIKIYPNILFKDYIKYKDVPKEMSKCDILLLPYLDQVSVRSNNLDTSKYMSPLKLFEYMAAKKVIIASRLSIYSHILKNNINCLLANNKNILEWEKAIKLVIKNKSFKITLSQNAFNHVQKFTWEKRVDKIIKKLI